MSTVLDSFLDVANRIQQGKAGTDFLIIKNECEGYENTPLEMELVHAFDALETELRKSPTDLSSTELEKLLLGLTNLAPAADGYRARMLKGAGDYADEDSTAKYVGEKVIALIRDCLREAEKTDRFPLVGVSEATLLMPLCLDSCGRYVGQPIFRQLFRDDMKTFRQPAFAKFFAADHQTIKELAGKLKQAADPEKRPLIRQLINTSLQTDQEGKRLADRILIALLEDPIAETRFDAQGGLELSGARAYPLILEAMSSKQAETRYHVVRILLKLYLDSYDSEVKPKIKQNLTDARKDPDKMVSSAASEAIQKINWQER